MRLSNARRLWNFYNFSTLLRKPESQKSEEWGSSIIRWLFHNVIQNPVSDAVRSPFHPGIIRINLVHIFGSNHLMLNKHCRRYGLVFQDIEG